MSCNGWFNVNVLLNDLEAVSGRGVQNIEPKYIVTGGAPPPFHTPDEENELLQMYGNVTDDGKVLQPDLSGIQKMLKMVNEACDYPTYDENKSIQQLNNEVNTIVTISKLPQVPVTVASKSNLNPNVPEFVPMSLLRNDVLSDDKLSSQVMKESNKSTSNELECNENKESSGNSSKSNNLVSKENHKPVSSHKEAKNNDIDISKKIDVSNLNSEEITNMKEKLILKIIDTSNAACLKKKQERNLALASLLKLNAKPAVKLMPPDYFKTIPGNEITTHDNITENYTKNAKLENDPNKDENESISISIDNINDVTTKESQHKSNNILRNSDPVRTASQDSSTDTSSAFNIPTLNSVLEQNSNTYLTKEMKESVKKVDAWLNTPNKKRKPKTSIHLGPVTFKRKGDVSVSPSVETVESAERNERPPSASETFVPSSYASELSKKYAERSKAIEIESEDMWTRVKRQLKEKDKAILMQ